MYVSQLSNFFLASPVSRVSPAMNLVESDGMEPVSEMVDAVYVDNQHFSPGQPPKSASPARSQKNLSQLSKFLSHGLGTPRSSSGIFSLFAIFKCLSEWV